MKKLVDTCGWIEWLTNGKLAHAFESYLLHTDSLITPTWLVTKAAKVLLGRLL